MSRRDSGGGDAKAILLADLVGLCLGDQPFFDSPCDAIKLLLFSDCAIIIFVKKLGHLIGGVLSAIGLLEADGGGETEEAEGSDGFHCDRSLLSILFCIITLASTAPFIVPRFPIVGKLTSQIT